MGRYNVHPAQGRGHYHDKKKYKDHSPTLDQLKEQKLLKKLKKKMKKYKEGRGA